MSARQLDPVNLHRDVVERVMNAYVAAREARLQTLLDGGIAKDRIGIITVRDCRICRGIGWTSTQYFADGHYMIEILDCPLCPGITVDGKSICSATRKDMWPGMDVRFE